MRDDQRSLGVSVVGAAFGITYVFGIVFPEAWWGTHALAFVSPVPRTALVLLAALTLCSVWGWRTIEPTTTAPPEPTRPVHWLMLAAIAFGCGLAFWLLPLAHDVYGDARTLRLRADDTVPAIPEGAAEALFSFGLGAWDGQSTVLAIVTYVAYFAGSTYRAAFTAVDAISGAGFVFVWLGFVWTVVDARLLRWTLAAAGLGAPFMLHFFGHLEANAPVLWLNLTWASLLVLALRGNSRLWWWLLAPLLLVCIKLHAVALLFVPVWGLAVAHRIGWLSRLDWTRAGIWVLLPVHVAGAIVYFFVLGDHADTRHLQTTALAYDRLFLPLFSPPPPLDRYNLLSTNHVLDYGNLVLLWSPIALFLLGSAALFWRDEIDWSAPTLVASGTGLVLFASLFFVVNPLLSMPMDWDLFSYPAPLLLVFTAVVVSGLRVPDFAPRVAPVCAGLLLLSTPVFWVHASKPMLSARLESVGVHIFESYYEWSTPVLGLALSLEDDPVRFAQRRDRLIERLEPWALPGRDYEFARLLSALGDNLARSAKDPLDALPYYQRARTYDPNDHRITLRELELHFLVRDFTRAYEVGLELLAVPYPNEQKARRILIHTALEAGMYSKALAQAEGYLEQFPSDPVILEVRSRIQAEDRLSEIKALFANLR